ncbi:MAG: four-carbon acid sugar kinase family protein [Anaerolineae bacterium]
MSHEASLQPIERQALWRRLPPEWPEDVWPQIREEVAASGHTVVVLDDDPTGTQTVHGVPVLTGWSLEDLRAELARDQRCFYILTNSRSLTAAQAEELNALLGERLRQAWEATGRSFVVVSRSDSTLRGHFPGEVAALARTLRAKFDGWLIIPFFLEGGRYTVNNVHYVDEGGVLVPAGQTEFARDPAFGYRSSDLREWVAEKMGPPITPADVEAISLEEIRLGGPGRVTDRLLGLNDGRPCVVNAASYRDMEVFVLGLLRAEARGKRYLYRTAASFVRVRAAIDPRGLLDAEDLADEREDAGVIVVGSHVPRSTRQLEELLCRSDVAAMELSVPRLLDATAREQEISRAVEDMESALRQGHHAVAYTSRDLIAGSSAEESLAIGRSVSDALVELVQRLSVRPRFIVAKGGITSSDVATRGLGVRRAEVLGQILPGIPVWRLGPESRFPGLTYVVFPGNVGGPTALAEVVARLAG